MTSTEVIEKLNIIIELQGQLITELCDELAQNIAVDNEEKLAEIEALKKEVRDIAL